MHSREDVLVCPCRGARVLNATVEVIAVLVNSKAIARACVVLELEQVALGQTHDFMLAPCGLLTVDRAVVDQPARAAL